MTGLSRSRSRRRNIPYAGCRVSIDTNKRGGRFGGGWILNSDRRLDRRSESPVDFGRANVAAVPDDEFVVRARSAKAEGRDGAARSRVSTA